MKAIKLKARLGKSPLTADGRPEIVRLGSGGRLFGDVYHWMLTSSRLAFFALLLGSYFLLNALFALAYLACGDGIANAHRGSFTDAFFFSVQTMATIGYGQMVPVGIAANLLVTVEAGIGLFGIAVASGLMFARFTRPTAGVRFSRSMVVDTFDGRPTLMFRLANKRRDGILEARIHVTMLRDETSGEGHEFRRLHDLTLLRSFTPAFGLTWTVMHPIDQASPLFGMSAEDLATSDTAFLVVFAGHHAGFYQEVHARAGYSYRDIHWNARFADMFVELPDGRTAIDYHRFDACEPSREQAPAVIEPVELPQAVGQAAGQ